MIRRWSAPAATLLALMACTPAPEPAEMAALQAAPACTPSPRMPLEGRASPYDSLAVPLGDAAARICYGRPSVKGRTIFGGLVPYDTLWRTGANEPTVLHLPVAAEVAGIRLEPGSYSLYTVPGRDGWQVVLNRSTTHWGAEGQYRGEVRAQEIARAPVVAERLPTPVETFTIRAQPSGPRATELLLEWENTRVRVPIRR